MPAGGGISVCLVEADVWENESAVRRGRQWEYMLSIKKRKVIELALKSRNSRCDQIHPTARGMR